MGVAIKEYWNLGRTHTTVTVVTNDSVQHGQPLPARKLWLWYNPQALRMVHAGLQEMAQGQTSDGAVPVTAPRARTEKPGKSQVGQSKPAKRRRSSP